MTHFIKISSKVDYTHRLWYFYNDTYNKIGDFDYYGYHAGEWYKERCYRGKFGFSKKPHKEWDNGRKKWNHNGDWYDSYEEYMLAVMG